MRSLSEVRNIYDKGLIGNLKQVFTNEGRAVDWFDVKQGEGRWFLQHATQVKNIWVPYGE